MSLALVGLAQPGVVIRNPGCTAKTYPGFFDDLMSLTADRIGIIDRGRLNFLGTLDDLRQALCDHQHSLEHLFLELTKSNGDDRAADAGPVHPDRIS